MSKRTSIELGCNNERIIDTLIEKGIYKTKIEAIRAAVREHGTKYGVPA
jgi:Arc/MetJ-type ribon-helix-helix transcriptional regulator